MQIEIIRDFVSFIITHNTAKFVLKKNMSISKGAFFWSRIIFIWAFFFNWAFLSEHLFSSEHFYLSIYFHLSILIWARFGNWAFWPEHEKKYLSIFFKDLSTNNHLSPTLNVMRLVSSWKSMQIVHLIVKINAIHFV